MPHPVVPYGRTYPDGYLSTWHTHPRHQLHYAERGLMMAEAADTDWAVPAGTGLLLPADMPHQVRMVGDVDVRTVYVARDAMQVASPRIVTIGPVLATLMSALASYDARELGGERARLLGRLILLDLASAPISPLALPLPTGPRLRAVCADFASNPAQRLSLDELARAAGRSRRAFTRDFREETGLSWGDWAKRLRCQVALQARAQGASWAEAAHRVGYAAPHSLKAMMAEFV